MADIFDEVEEQVRQERYLELLRRYGVYVLGAIALALIGVAGWRLYEGWQAQQARNASDQLQAAVRQVAENDRAGPGAIAELAERGPGVYRVFALGVQAQEALEGGDLAAAVQRLDVAAEAATDPLVANMARLRAAYIVADTQDFEALDRRLAPLIAAGGPISFLARELRGIEAWEAGRNEIARQAFEGLTLAFDAPQGVRQRAQAALSVLGPAPAAAAATPATPAAPARPAAAPSGASQ